MNKQAPSLPQVHQAVVEGGGPEAVAVEVRRVEGAEVKERWSVVGSKAHQRWVWPALDPLTGVGLADGLGPRADVVFEQVHAWLKPCGLAHFYPAAGGVSDRSRPAADHAVGTIPTPQLERKQLPLRTRSKRLAGKTICFSKSGFMHAIVLGLLVNRYEFGNFV